MMVPHVSTVSSLPNRAFGGVAKVDFVLAGQFIPLP